MVNVGLPFKKWSKRTLKQKADFSIKKNPKVDLSN